MPSSRPRAQPWWLPSLRSAARSEHVAQRMAVERVAELEIRVEHGVALVAAELLQAGRMHAAIHAGGQRAALEAVAAPAVPSNPAARARALDDPGDAARIEWRPAERGAAAGRLRPRAVAARAAGTPAPR